MHVGSLGSTAYVLRPLTPAAADASDAVATFSGVTQLGLLDPAAGTWTPVVTGGVRAWPAVAADGSFALALAQPTNETVLVSGRGTDVRELRAPGLLGVAGRYPGGTVVTGLTAEAQLWRDGADRLEPLPGVDAGELRAVRAGRLLVAQPRERTCASPLMTASVVDPADGRTLWTGCTLSKDVSGDPLDGVDAAEGPLAPDGAHVVAADRWFSPVDLATGRAAGDGPDTRRWRVQPEVSWNAPGTTVHVRFAADGRPVEVACTVDGDCARVG